MGIDPSGLVVADFNGDGRPDLAVADAGSDDVMVLLGLGDGTFSSPIVLPVGESPHAIVAGDFLHDGITDIAVADETSNDVAVLIGRGDGTFLPARRYRGRGRARRAGGRGPQRRRLHRPGHGQSHLRRPDDPVGPGRAAASRRRPSQYGGHAPSALAVGDFNGDGRLDLAVADEQDDEVSVLLSLGGGAFAPPSSFDVGTAARLPPGHPRSPPGTQRRLVAAGADSQDCRRPASSAATARRSRACTSRWGSSPIGQVLGDFNGDGVPDMAMVTASSDQVVVQLGTSSGQLLPPDDAAPLPQPAPVVVDWNGDGTPDVFTLDQQGQLLLRLGQPGSPGEFERAAGHRRGPRASASATSPWSRPAYGPVLAALDAEQPVIWLFSHAPGPGGRIEVAVDPGARRLAPRVDHGGRPRPRRPGRPRARGSGQRPGDRARPAARRLVPRGRGRRSTSATPRPTSRSPT